MPVGHISGLGIFLGAVTRMLTCIYLLLKASSEGNPQAVNIRIGSSRLANLLKQQI